MALFGNGKGSFFGQQRRERPRNNRDVDPAEKTHWVALVSTFDGGADLVMLVLLAGNLYFYAVPYPSWAPDPWIHIGFALLGVWLAVSAFGWLLKGSFVRARAATQQANTAFYPWFVCIRKPRFLLAVLLSNVIGLVVLLMGLYTLLDLASLYGLNGGPIYTTLWNIFAALRLTSGLSAPA